MQGIPGSGKSTVANAIATSDDPNAHPSELFHQEQASVYSTDEFWMKDGKYEFDISRLGEAHHWNQMRATKAMKFGTTRVIIDNTNIKNRDIVPYLIAGHMYGYAIHVVRVETPVETCIARQANRPEDRRIPEDVIRRMHDQMETLNV